MTAKLTVTGAYFTEAQNGGADLRLAATDPSQPLIVHEVSLTATP